MASKGSLARPTLSRKDSQSGDVNKKQTTLASKFKFQLAALRQTIASTDPNYFRSSMGTLFLGYIAEVINRLLPKHLKAGS